MSKDESPPINDEDYLELTDMRVNRFSGTKSLNMLDLYSPQGKGTFTRVPVSLSADRYRTFLAGPAIKGLLTDERSSSYLQCPTEFEFLPGLEITTTTSPSSTLPDLKLEVGTVPGLSDEMRLLLSETASMRFTKAADGVWKARHSLGIKGFGVLVEEPELDETGMEDVVEGHKLFREETEYEVDIAVMLYHPEVPGVESCFQISLGSDQSKSLPKCSGAT